MLVVREVEKFYAECNVYNIEVEGEHSYVAGTFGVNNCSGLYWIVSDIDETIISHVNWSKADEPSYELGGSVLVGDCTVTIAIDSLSEEEIKSIKYLIADSRKLQIYRTQYKGVKERDRIMFLCKEQEEV